MPELKLLIYHGLLIRIRSDDEELLKEKEMFKNELCSMLEFKYSEIEIIINENDFRLGFMSKFEYINFDLVLDASHIPNNIRFYMKIFGDIKPLPSDGEANRITTFHFEFDERGDKARIYDNYKMEDYKMDNINPRWMIFRAIRNKDNKFIRWLICSYPDDANDTDYLMEAVRYDNAEAFRLFEPIVKDKLEDNMLIVRYYLINEANRYKHPEYAEYIKNHYL